MPMESNQSETPFAMWAILEIMGHRRLGGFVSEQQIAGAAFLRIDVPGPEGNITASQFYAPSSIYCITPTSEETARRTALANQPAPVQEWQLPALPAFKPQPVPPDLPPLDGPDSVQEWQAPAISAQDQIPNGEDEDVLF